MDKYTLFAMQLGLRAVSEIFRFMRILTVFSFGAAAIATIIVSRAHLMTELQMNQLWEENNTVIITILVFAVAVDMLLDWLRNHIVFQSLRILNALNAILFQKPETVNLHETQP